jgi:hypothetical protein
VDTAVNCRFLYLLLNNEVHSLTFTNLPTTHKQQMNCVSKTWFAMTKKCPRLQKLVVREEGRYPDVMKFNDLVRILSRTFHFVHLQELEADKFGFNNIRLALLANNLPKLR